MTNPVYYPVWPQRQVYYPFYPPQFSDSSAMVGYIPEGEFIQNLAQSPGNSSPRVIEASEISPKKLEPPRKPDTPSPPSSHQPRQVTNKKGIEEVEPKVIKPPRRLTPRKYNPQWMQKRLCTIMCRYGDSCMLDQCRFAHDFKELRRRVVGHSFKAVPCTNYPNCAYNEHCHFLHNNETEQRANNTCTRCAILFQDKTPVAKICRVSKWVKPQCKCFDED